MLILIYAAKLVLCISGNNQVFWPKVDCKSLQQFQSTLWNGLPYFLATAGTTQKWTLFFFFCIGSLILAIIINYNDVKFEEKSETCCWRFFMVGTCIFLGFSLYALKFYSHKLHSDISWEHYWKKFEFRLHWLVNSHFSVSLRSEFPKFWYLNMNWLLNSK